MLVAGDHARNDMAGEENSFVTVLNENGYETEAVIKGLGEYPEFREIYVRKVEEMI
jgi:sirohydrochlorin cobaltochelatase